METVNASYFKTHFGDILTRASTGVVRITRRGMNASVLMPEAEYRELKRKAARPALEEEEALQRLRHLAETVPEGQERLLSDVRARAILDKHASHTGDA